MCKIYRYLEKHFFSKGIFEVFMGFEIFFVLAGGAKEQFHLWVGGYFLY